MNTPNLKFTLPAILSLALPGFSGAQDDSAGTAIPEGPDLTLISSRTIEMKPSEKRPLLVKPTERNPYVKRAPEEEEVPEAGEDSQETRIRSKLLSMPVGGRSVGPRGLRLLVGDMVLEKGKIVDQLLAEQTEFLKVIEISEDALKFGWLDPESGELTGKTMQIGYDLSPGVRYLLPGQRGLDEEGSTQGRLMGIHKADRGRSKYASDPKSNPNTRLGATVQDDDQ
ncbi:MAG: hypothetical protein HKN23_21715 [Verrucomicrobiales bacterium]|nr:hypothetical protein [Verrucomicrobiales bacterium]